MGWPQWVVVVLFGLRLLLTAHYHGKPRVRPDTGKVETFSFPMAASNVAVYAFLLWAGGFFDGVG